MRALLAVLLAALLLLAAPAGAAAKPKACKRYRMDPDSYVGSIVPLCMPGFKLTCSAACRKHLRKVNLKCFSALIKERMPQRLTNSVRFYRACTK